MCYGMYFYRVISVLSDDDLENFVTLSPDDGTIYPVGSTVTVSVTVATESQHVDAVSIDVDLAGPYTFGEKICLILTERPCSRNLKFTRRELAHIKVRVYYGCTTLFRQHTIAIDGTGKGYLLQCLALLQKYIICVNVCNVNFLC